MTPLQLLSTIKPELRPKSVFKRIMFRIIDASPKVKGRTLEFIKDLKKEKHACEWALKLAQLLITNDNSWQKTESWTDKRGSKVHEYGKTTSALKHEQKIAIAQEANIDQKPDTPLLLATKHNCPEIVEEILKVYPQAVEHVDKEGHNILHLAILHRRLAIIDVMENMEYPLQRLRGRLDKKYNTLLHMVGLKANDLEDEVKDPAKQLKDDQRLYKRVAKISTTVDLMTRNSDMKTPQEVFFETNDKHREEAKRWMSENAKNCSIVAVLIATVAFTSAYQIPGGNNNGHPVLKGKPMFLLFALADAVSLSSAFTSVIIFLNIVTSPFRFKDFESSLYEKQLAALILLIISVAMMMVAFAATLVLTVSNNATWTNLTLYVVSFFPVFVFVYEYIQVYSKIIVDFWSMLKNMKVKVVLMFHDIWDYKRQSLHSVSGFVHLPTGSLV
nr:ankyrin repeat-containing protein ITN1-like [Erigeron canadensis]